MSKEETQSAISPHKIEEAKPILKSKKVETLPHIFGEEKPLDDLPVLPIPDNSMKRLHVPE